MVDHAKATHLTAAEEASAVAKRDCLRDAGEDRSLREGIALSSVGGAGFDGRGGGAEKVEGVFGQCAKDVAGEGEQLNLLLLGERGVCVLLLSVFLVERRAPPLILTSL